MKLTLYVWEGVLEGYHYGIMFAYAESLEQARQLLRAKLGHCDEYDISKNPIEVSTPRAFYVYGGD